jgi:hypothetical protein
VLPVLLQVVVGHQETQAVPLLGWQRAGRRSAQLIFGEQNRSMTAQGEWRVRGLDIGMARHPPRPASVA